MDLSLIVPLRFPGERPRTLPLRNHLLTNAAVWSPDGWWIVYDVRSDAAGSRFDGTRIERVNVVDGTIETLYESRDGACVGVVTCSPVDDRVVFIHGPERPTADWCYGACHRQGLIAGAGRVENLDARDIVPPFTPGALRGGSHVHTFDGRGEWIAFTYEDHVLAQLDPILNQRNVGISVPGLPVAVPGTHPRNHNGSHFSVLVTRTTAHPQHGSDEISKAFEEAWVGRGGYLRANGTRQRRAIAFQGIVASGISELFIVDLPGDVTHPGDEPLEGTATRAPCPPRGCVQRRLTYTESRRFAGIQGPRHWPRSHPDGSQIAFLMKDDAGIVQIWIVSPAGGEPRQVTHNPWDIASAFSWSPDGRSIAHIMDHSVFSTDVVTGESKRLTERTPDATSPRPEACVFSPDGSRIAYVRTVENFNQIFTVDVGSMHVLPASFRHAR